MILAIDFDGTLCKHAFPEIGEMNADVFHAVLTLKKQGHTILLWTCRCGAYLDAAVAWCKERGLEFDAINDNAPEMVARGWESRKIYADYYIDDRNMLIGQFIEVLAMSESGEGITKQ